MAGSKLRRQGLSTLGGICLVLWAAGAFFPSAGLGGGPADASGLDHDRSMRLSLRIAQAEGNPGRVTKYKSLARQHRARRHAPVRFNPPGTPASRPGRPP